jgi:predicted DNA-binding transcriptional regulator YafY
MRADRLISLLMLLQTRNGLTARQLAGELEVSERTIYRDLTALSAAGIPVYTQSGPGGGCFLVEDYRTNLTGMNSEQLRALFMLSVPAPLDQLGFSQDLKAAMLKLSAALPSTHRDEEEQTRQRLFLDWGFDASQDEPVPHLKTVQQAVWEDRKLELRYRSLFAPWIEALERVAVPYGLVAWAGNWYLVCSWDGMGHVIRLSLIETVEVLPERFSRDPQFELSKFWLDWRRRYEADRPAYPVRVRVAPQMVPFLRRLQAGPPDAQGWVTGTLTFDTFEIARARILSYGGAVQVLEPEALRCSVLDFVRQIEKLYNAVS